MKERYKIVCQQRLFSRRCYTNSLALAIRYVDHISPTCKRAFVADTKNGNIIYEGRRLCTK